MILTSNNLARDDEGFLKNSEDWNESVAKFIALEEGIDLSDEHWEVVHLVRTFYINFNTVPTVYILVKALSRKFGQDKGNSRYLFRLFPQGPARQAAKIAGLPKPVRCL
ncbi:MAG: TusE/DsrC/DsvC family sulfur relay protein [Candidatus Dasytiphilus stammeri]